MSFAETANLAVQLKLGGNFTSQLAKTRAGLRGFDKDAGRAGKAAGQIGTGIKRGAVIAAAGIGFLAAQVAIGLDSLSQLESQTAQTNAVLKSTKGAAGISAAAVGTLAQKYESMNATIGDEVIRNVENLMLTFTNIKGKAFEPTLAAILNMNQALGGGPEGLQGVALKVGRALSDPVKGITALTRSGVVFTDQQKKQITALVKSGHLLDAQKIVLKELNTEFGGSFLAGGNTTAGKIAKFTDSIDDLQRALATALLPTIGKVADKLSAFLADPKVVAEVSKLGENIASLFSDKNIAEGGAIISDVFNAAKAAAPVLAATAKTMAGFLTMAVKAFTSLPKEIQALAIGGFAVNKLTGGLVTNIAGGIFGALKAMTVQAGVVNVTGGIVNGGGGLPGAGAGGGGAGPGLPGAVAGGAGIAGMGAIPLALLGGTVAAFGAGAVFAMQSKSPEMNRPGGHLGPGDLPANKGKTIPVRVTNTVPGLTGQHGGQLPVTKGRFGQQAPMDAKTVAAIKAAQAEASRKAAEIKGASIAAAAGTRDTSSSVRSGTASLVGAIGRQPVPIVNVKVNVTPAQVQKSTVIQYRYGPATGSSGGTARSNRSVAS